MKILWIAPSLLTVTLLSSSCRTVENKESNSALRADETTQAYVNCDAGAGKSIRFLPQFGEVHYLKADGSEWKQHDDGMRFEGKFLESMPPQFQTLITDDEGHSIGNWSFPEGATTFEAKYRNKTYSGCKNVLPPTAGPSPRPVNTPNPNPRSGQPTYTCAAGAGKLIRFLPEFGEVHFLKTDGSEWKQHEDGMHFEMKSLESMPPQVSMAITDDEGHMIGNWLYMEGAPTFSAKYRTKTYSGCKADAVNTNPGPGNGNQAGAYVCPAGSGKLIKFIPQFGEVHFLKTDGTEWKQHEDGMRFEMKSLESMPPQVSMNIIDDEQNSIGGWLFFEGESTFKATYRNKTYLGCKKAQ